MTRLSIANSQPREKTAESSPKSPRLRLEYLDGLRGLAALYVLLYHTGLLMASATSHLSQSNLLTRNIFKLWFYGFLIYGHFAVVVFIVLSGYVLMLPVARSEDGSLPGGVKGYLWRRARRILPPYYAALGLSLLLYLCIPQINLPNGYADIELPALKTGPILSHLLLIHNHSGAWEAKINSPMWSIAVEWQIYFLFPLILLPLWRRFGSVVTFLVAFVLGVASFYAGIGGTYAWMVGCFAQGMFAASVGFWRRHPEQRWLQGLLWNKVAFAALCPILLLPLVQRRFVKHTFWGHWVQPLLGYSPLQDFLVGLGAASLLIFFTKQIQERPLGCQSVMLRWLQSKPVVGLGAFSYSLYLVHAPLLRIVGVWFRSHSSFSGGEVVGIACGICVPLIVCFAYLFHLVFERPFMPTHLRKGQAVSLHAAPAAEASADVSQGRMGQ